MSADRPLSDSHSLSRRNDPSTHSQYSSGVHVSRIQPCSLTRDPQGRRRLLTVAWQYSRARARLPPLPSLCGLLSPLRRRRRHCHGIAGTVHEGLLPSRHRCVERSGVQGPRDGYAGTNHPGAAASLRRDARPEASAEGGARETDRPCPGGARLRQQDAHPRQRPTLDAIR
jgi:hypothetical protein